MFISDNNRFLAQEEVDKHFVLEGSKLYRKLADGSVKQLKSLDGTKVVTLFNSHRLIGADIAWCLLYGNWPQFPLVLLGADPLDFTPTNIYPARTRRLRYMHSQKGALHYHSLSRLPFVSEERCRADWEDTAREFYKKDLPYVLRLEEAERGLRASYVDDLREVQKVVPLPVAAVRGKRPRQLAGYEWHWNAGEWIAVPEACHVSDDYMVRIRRQRAGAVRHEFQPLHQEVWGFNAAGEVVL